MNSRVWSRRWNLRAERIADAVGHGIAVCLWWGILCGAVMAVALWLGEKA